MTENIDYNLLRTYVLLYRHRSLKEVGQALGVTESAVSKHLSKLREQLNDPLFVRNAHGFEPTIYTEQVIPTLTDGLSSIQNALKGVTLEPENYTGDIKIALIPILHLQIGAELLIDIKKNFPKATISLTTYDDNTYKNITNGNIELGVNYFNPTLNKVVYQAHIKKLKHGIILPALLADLSDEEIFKLPFIGIKARGRGDIRVLLDDVDERVDQELNYYCYVDNLSCALDIIDKVTGFTIVQAYKWKDKRFALRVLPEKYQQVDNFSLVAVMKSSNQRNPLHALLLDIIKSNIEPFVLT